MKPIAKRKGPRARRLARAESPPAVEHTRFVAVVHVGDRVRLVAVADSRRDLVHQLATYVGRWGPYVLPEDHARHLRGLLARRELEAAVELYFGLVGKRWDKEWLVTAVTTADHREVVAVLGKVAPPDVGPRRPRLKNAS